MDEFLAAGPPAADGDACGAVVDPTADMIRRRVPLESGGTVLGFEPLVADHGLGCSWLCNGIDRDAAEKLKIATNAAGLIDALEDAQRVVALIREQGNAEPGLWLPWVLVRYGD